MGERILNRDPGVPYEGTQGRGGWTDKNTCIQQHNEHIYTCEGMYVHTAYMQCGLLMQCDLHMHSLSKCLCDQGDKIRVSLRLSPHARQRSETYE